LPAQFELPFQLLTDQAQTTLSSDVYSEADIHTYLHQRNMAAAFVHTTPPDVWQLESVLTGTVVLYKTD
jgi:hypothetical protein